MWLRLWLRLRLRLRLKVGPAEVVVGRVADLV